MATRMRPRPFRNNPSDIVSETMAAIRQEKNPAFCQAKSLRDMGYRAIVRRDLKLVGSPAHLVLTDALLKSFKDISWPENGVIPREARVLLIDGRNNLDPMEVFRELQKLH